MNLYIFISFIFCTNESTVHIAFSTLFSLTIYHGEASGEGGNIRIYLSYSFNAWIALHCMSLTTVLLIDICFQSSLCSCILG